MFQLDLHTREKEGKGKMQVQKQVVEALLSPMAYDEPPGQIELVQTHISYVFLTKKLVYKVKKAVNFGFLDFETLEKRKYYCEKELQLNKRLCGDMYIEVVPINEAKSIKIRGEGKTVEYALKMKRMPQERVMTRLLEENMVYEKLIADIAKIIVEFHSKAETNDEISQFGSLKVIKTNWDENFDQTQNVVDKTISKEDFELIQNKINLFMSKNSLLINKRMIDGKVRDCHGDIHSGNIFVTDRVYIFDAIEFNERFRYSDIAADVAFLAMDLDFKDRRDLSDFFVNKYVEFSGDQELRKLLSFYKCYRAYVRGKVVGFKLYDPNVGSEEKKKACIEAQTYFKLAASYANKLYL
jgi:aminoglycoside phosphotransferase family enzyme